MTHSHSPNEFVVDAPATLRFGDAEIQTIVLKVSDDQVAVNMPSGMVFWFKKSADGHSATTDVEGMVLTPEETQAEEPNKWAFLDEVKDLLAPSEDNGTESPNPQVWTPQPPINSYLL